MAGTRLLFDEQPLPSGGGDAPAEESAADYEQLRRDWVLGSEEFRQELLAAVGERVGPNRYGAERQVLEKGISNLEFHYLGSAKILGSVGKGLAEAMAELNQLKQLKKIN